MTGLQLFTLIHVAISLIGIGSGLIVIFGFLAGILSRVWNSIFLASTITTSVTGFLFPFKGVTPGIVIGVVSLIVLLLALIALRKRWTKTYIASVSAAAFFNVLVFIVQVFEKVSALHRYAPKGNEPIVAVIQLIALVTFVGLALAGIRKSTATLQEALNKPF